MRAGVGAAVTGDALAFAEIVLVHADGDRAAAFAELAAARAAVGRAAELAEGQDRQEREHRTHRAEKLAEEPLLQRHADDDQHQQHNGDDAARGRQTQRRKQREDFPRAPKAERAIEIQRAEHDDGGKDEILDLLPPSIAAASIVAKVTRDRMMVEMDAKYPGYGFAGNKGYGSAEHIQAIREKGPCEIHRRTFIRGFVEE